MIRRRGVKGGPALPWSTRYKVALGIADSLGYLHYGTERCFVHRDIKPSNILLSSKKTPKLCAFGLATWTPAPSVPFLCKIVKGTFGYLALEYFQHGKVSDKTDVYAFGVVLLELLTGRKSIEAKRGPREENSVLWDIFMPLLRRINTSTNTKAYASRTLLFLQDNRTLKPVAIELMLLHPNGDQFGIVGKVYTLSE